MKRRIGFCALMTCTVMSAMHAYGQLAGGPPCWTFDPTTTNWTAGGVPICGSLLSANGNAGGNLPANQADLFATDGPDGNHWHMLRTGALIGSLQVNGNNWTLKNNVATGRLFMLNQADNGFFLAPDATAVPAGNGQTNNRLGFMALGENTHMTPTTARAPWSRLHLVDEAGGVANAGAYRGWMHNGITMSGFNDLMYIGQRSLAPGSANAAIMWGDNIQNNFQFIFGGPVTTGGIANGVNGLEVMRLRAPSVNEGYVGIGDFTTAGTDPQDRLDVLTGDVRIRELSLPVNNSPLLDRFVVVDPATGELRWRNLASITDCDWELTGTSNVVTAYAPSGTNPGCPEEGNAVGIGTNTPTAKLHVETDDFDTGARIVSNQATTENKGLVITATGGWDKQDGIVITTVAPGLPCAVIPNQDHCINVGIRTTQSGPVGRSRGIIATTSGATYTGYGGVFTSNDLAPYTWGVAGTATGGSSNSFGVQGSTVSAGADNRGVSGDATGAGTINYGLYGEACNAAANYGVYGKTCTTGPNDWAGFFEGNVTINGQGFLPSGVAILSDASLKRNVMDLHGAGELLGKLRPTTYEFAKEAHPAINLPSGSQMGLIAQEVEKVLPQVVKPVTIPAQRDKEGNAIGTEEHLKAVQYEALIPLLIAGYQEQQATIEELRAEIEQLKGASNAGTMMGNSKDGKVGGTSLRIAPNPFQGHTTIAYTIEQAGRVRIAVTTADGKPLRTLVDSAHEAGRFTYEWDTEGLAAGMYFCTLLVNDKPLVQQVVKVAQP